MKMKLGENRWLCVIPICMLHLIGSILAATSTSTSTTTTSTTTTSTTKSPGGDKHAKLAPGQGKPKEEEHDAKFAKIVNGRDAGPGELPFQASISITSDTGTSQCGGVLIGEQWVLTAAHCVKGACADDGSGSEKPTEYRQPEDIQVTLGEHSLSAEDGETVFKVSEVIPHEDYTCGGANDITLLKLSEPVSYQITENGYGSINRVGLPETVDAKYEAGTRAVVAGWGLTDPALKQGSDVLQIAQVEIMDDEECKTHAARDVTIEAQLCATDPEGGSNACRGDSGGPLLQAQDDGGYELVGIVSFGAGNCDGFTIYSRVDHYLQWLADRIN